MIKQMLNSKRESGIELLRMMAGMAVVVLHYNFLGEGGAMSVVHGVTYYVLLAFEVLCLPAVNVFLIISGYFSCEKMDVSVVKTLKLVVQVMAFNFVINLAGCIVSGQLSMTGLLRSLVPANYFVILYVVMMLLSPFINYLISKISVKSLTTLAILLICLFTVYTTLLDVLEEIFSFGFSGTNSVSINGDIAGYTIVNFILMYIVGAFLKKLKVDTITKVKRHTCVICVAICVVMGMIWHLLLPKTAFMYCNPLIVFESVAIFVLFLKLKFTSKVINFVAPASFSCFLIQFAFLSRIDSTFWENAGVIKVLVHLLCVVVVIYLASIVVYFVWEICTKKLFAFIDSKIPYIKVR